MDASAPCRLTTPSQVCPSGVWLQRGEARMERDEEELFGVEGMDLVESSPDAGSST